MSRSRDRDAPIYMPEKLPEALRQLMEETYQRLKRLRDLDPQSPADGQFQFDELTDMSQRFLSLASSFLKVVQLCQQARQEMQRRAEERAGKRDSIRERKRRRKRTKNPDKP